MAGAFEIVMQERKALVDTGKPVSDQTEGACQISGRA